MTYMLLLNCTLKLVEERILFVTIVYQQFRTAPCSHIQHIEDSTDGLSQNVIQRPLPIYAA